MPARDKFHDAVRNALVKDGWTITADPLTIEFGEDTMFIDLAGEKLIEAEKDSRRIAVEVKTFSGASKLADLEVAVGQYVIYRDALEQTDPGRELFLAAPEWIVQNRFRTRQLWKTIVNKQRLKLVGYDPVAEEIVSWPP